MQFSVGKRHEVMGSALHVYLPDTVNKGKEIKVTVTYATTKASTALQWLDKEYALDLGFSGSLVC